MESTVRTREPPSDESSRSASFSADPFVTEPFFSKNPLQSMSFVWVASPPPPPLPGRPPPPPPPPPRLPTSSSESRISVPESAEVVLPRGAPFMTSHSTLIFEWWEFALLVRFWQWAWAETLIVPL